MSLEALWRERRHATFPYSALDDEARTCFGRLDQIIQAVLSI